MRTVLNVIFWGIQVNLVAWLIAVAVTECRDIPVLVGLGVGAVLEHVAVRHLRPKMAQMSGGAGEPEKGSEANKPAKGKAEGNLDGF